ncbi:MAG: hypothetical protein KBA75_10680 [Alphaproteobacteria bacterium]|nr:hypothetical protein [Alphaproteobacteria bacterium]
MKPRRYRPNRYQLLAKLRRQSALVRANREWARAPELVELLGLLNAAPLHKRFITYCGIRFPLSCGLVVRAAWCPDTNTPLVGSV